MSARCVVCGRRCKTGRSSVYCSRHYWKLRRLAEKPRFELDALAEEADHTKRLIEIVIEHEPTDDDVADLQR